MIEIKNREIKDAFNKILENFKVEEFKVFQKKNSEEIVFKLEETQGWRYNISCYYDIDSRVHLFGEHEKLIDKFRPERCYVDETNIQSFIEVIKNIQENPKFHFVNSLTLGDAEVDWNEIECGNEHIYEGYQVRYKYNEQGILVATRDESITQEDFINREYEEFFKEEN